MTSRKNEYYGLSDLGTLRDFIRVCALTGHDICTLCSNNHCRLADLDVIHIFYILSIFINIPNNDNFVHLSVISLYLFKLT